MDIPETKIIEIKTGSEAIFDIAYTYTDEEIAAMEAADPGSTDSLVDNGIDIGTGYEISIVFRNPKTQVILANCTIGDGITITDGPRGMYTVDAGNTQDWPLALIPVDIRYTNLGKARHTETFGIRMLRGIS